MVGQTPNKTCLNECVILIKQKILILYSKFYDVNKFQRQIKHDH